MENDRIAAKRTERRFKTVTAKRKVHRLFFDKKNTKTLCWKLTTSIDCPFSSPAYGGTIPN